MAVDANVLIFERIKEEINNEKNKIIAFDSGYIKSRTTILDANITTLISAAILFFLGSGPVKGFSVTLGVGILTTLFSAYFFARHLTSFYVLRNKALKVTTEEDIVGAIIFLATNMSSYVTGQNIIIDGGFTTK